MSQYQISLDALLARDVAVQWFEGVALVQTVCRQVAAGGSASGFPPASQIVLRADGSITLVGSTWTGDAVEGAARLLGDLQSGDVPVQLRLLLTQAMGSDRTYPTLNDFSAALAYFERSAPQMILQQLFQRAALAATRHESRQPAIEPAPVEKAREQNARTPDKHRKKGNAARSIVAAAAVLAMLAAGIWYVGFGPGRGRAAAAGVTLMKQLGLGTPATAAENAENAGAPGPVERETASSQARRKNVAPARASTSGPSKSESSSVGVRSVRSGNRPAALVPGRPGGAEPLPLTPASVAVYEIFATPAKMVEAAAPLVVAPELDMRIYSATDAQVVPPRAIYPRFPATPPEAQIGRRTVVEVVVDDSGLVERVRLRTRPQNIHEFMLLSAAKAWRFEPATMNGRPVRFLQRLTLAMP